MTLFRPHPTLQGEGICQTCFGTVQKGEQPQHARWHERQERRLRELETAVRAIKEGALRRPR